LARVFALNWQCHDGSAGCTFQPNYLSICHYLRAWIVSWKAKAYFGFLIAARSRAPTSSASDWPREVLEPVNSIVEDGVNGLASRNYGSDRGNCSKYGKKDDEQNYSIFHGAHLASCDG
jgi:hypothetical protein